MRRVLFIVFALMLVSSISFARGRACYYTHELIAKKCKKGDIIRVEGGELAYFCDFNKTIINDANDPNGSLNTWFLCVYVGYKREDRK